MQKLGLSGFLCGLALLCRAEAADLPAQAPPPASAPSCFASFLDYFLASAEGCPLTWNGITLYGTIDMGAGYQTHGVPFNDVYPNGVEELISKNSNRSRYVLIPNGLGQSNIGVKGSEAIAGDWSLVFNLQNGFDPYTLQRANGPKSLVQNNTTPLDGKPPTAIPAARGNCSTPSLTRASVIRPSER